MYGLDLFSGIGGITKALEGYIWPVAYCENNRYAQAVLLQRIVSGDLPSAPIWDDVSTLRQSMLPSGIDIIYGGFPCQDISVAGRGAGLAGKRSGLFFEIERLVSEIRPRFVLLENVPAIRTRGADIVVKELARLRYDCRWDLLSAADVGANHIRKRWWLLAHTQSEQSGRIRKPKLPPNTGTGDPVENSEFNGLEKSRNSSIQGRKADPTPNASWWEVEPRVGRMVDELPFRVDRLRGLGNAAVPAQAREAFERLIGMI